MKSFQVCYEQAEAMPCTVTVLNLARGAAAEAPRQNACYFLPTLLSVGPLHGSHARYPKLAPFLVAVPSRPQQPPLHEEDKKKIDAKKLKELEATSDAFTVFACCAELQLLMLKIPLLLLLQLCMKMNTRIKNEIHGGINFL